MKHIAEGITVGLEEKRVAKEQQDAKNIEKEEQKKAKEEYGVMQQRAQFVGQQLQQEDQALQASGQVEMDSMVSNVKKEIEAYGKANGYTYVLGGGDGGSVLYGTDANDLTDEIVKLLNDKYKN